MRRRFLVAAVLCLALLGGVMGGRELSAIPGPDRTDAFRPAGWPGGEKYLRVQRVGDDHWLVTIAASHVVASTIVKDKTPEGDLIRERTVMLIASPAGLTDPVPPEEWWKAALEIQPLKRKRLDVPPMPSAADGGFPK